MDLKTVRLVQHRMEGVDRPFYVGRHGPGRVIQAQKHLSVLHTHVGLELAGIISGTAIEHFNGKDYPVKAGDILVIDPVFFHEMSDRNEVDLIDCHLTRQSVVDAHVDKSELVMLRPFEALHRGMSIVFEDMHAAVERLFEAWRLFSEGSASAKQQAFGLVVAVLGEVARRADQTVASTDDPSWRKNHVVVSGAMQFIHAHFARNFSLDDMASHLGISKSRLCHGFKDFSGMSPVEFRSRLRISHSVDLLKSTDLKISAIAFECGFGNVSAFHRLFRKVTGLTPGEVRNE